MPTIATLCVTAQSGLPSHSRTSAPPPSQQSCARECVPKGRDCVKT